MNNPKQSEVERMTETEIKMLLEAIQIIAERCETKEEFIRELNRIKSQGKKKPQ